MTRTNAKNAEDIQVLIMVIPILASVGGAMIAIIPFVVIVMNYCMKTVHIIEMGMHIVVIAMTITIMILFIIIIMNHHYTF